MAFISSLQADGIKFCPVCGKRIAVENNLINEHKNKYEKLCYGSFMPYRDINPFKSLKKKRASSTSSFLEDVYGQVDNYGQGQEDDIGNELDWLNQVVDAEFVVDPTPGATNC
jgi:hypothetical protein